MGHYPYRTLSTPFRESIPLMKSIHCFHGNLSPMTFWRKRGRRSKRTRGEKDSDMLSPSPPSSLSHPTIPLYRGSIESVTLMLNRHIPLRDLNYQPMYIYIYMTIHRDLFQHPSFLGERTFCSYQITYPSSKILWLSFIINRLC